MRTLIHNAEIYAEKQKIDNGYLLIDNGIIRLIGIGEYSAKDVDSTIDAKGHPVIPGFIDLQANGGGGNLFMDATPQAIENILNTHIKHGVTGMLGTTVAWTDQQQYDAIECCKSYIRQQHSGSPLLGVHMEGPFINKTKAGTHNRNFLYNPSIEKLNNFLEKGDGIIKMITIAPELDGGMDLIAYGKSKGICMSIGHSTATFDEANKAIECGASMGTHLFNAMNGITARDPGIISAVLSHKDTFGSIVCDGVHVHPENIKSMYRIGGAEHLILITDCAPIAGTGKKEWMLENNKVIIRGYTGYLENGTLAGSCLTLNKAAMIAKQILNCSINEIILMGCTNPAKAIGIFDRKGSIAVNKDADIVILNNCEDFDADYVFIEGKLKYKR